MMTRKLVNRTISVAVLVAAVVFFCVLYYYEIEVGERIQRRFGFELDSPYSAETGEVLVIDRVKLGGVFDSVGFRKGDIITDKGGIIGFYRTLNRAKQGDTISFVVLPFNDERPLAERPRRTILLKIP